MDTKAADIERLRCELEATRGQLVSVTEALQQSSDELHLLYSLAESLRLDNDLQRVAEVTVQALREALQADGGGLFLKEPDQPWRLLYGETLDEASDTFLHSPQACDWAEHVARRRDILLVKRGEALDDKPTLPLEVTGLVGTPLRLRIGNAALLLCNRRGGFQRHDARLAMAASVQCGPAFETAILYRQFEDTFGGSMQALAAAIDGHSTWTAGHSHRVTTHALRLAQRLRLDEAFMGKVRLAGLLHDIGKICVPQAILDKPERLMDLEFAILKQHPVVGAHMLHHIRSFKGEVLDGVLYHHERMDGSGYPEGRTRGDIPFMGKLLAVADAFDAMTSARPYRRSVESWKAMEVLKEGRVKYWDGELVRAFDATIRNCDGSAFSQLLIRG